MKIINLIKFLILCIFAIISVFFAFNTSLTKEYDGLEVTFLDVGQGDCVYIKTPDNHRFFIDTGDKGSYKKYIKPFIDKKKILYIDGVILSHYNSDHFYGLYEMLGSIDINKIFVPDIKNKNFLSDMLDEKAKYNNVMCKSVRSNDVIYESDDIKIYTIFPDDEIFKDEDASSNNNCVVVMLEYKNIKLLFTGDLEKDAEKTLVKNKELDVDILKVAHHGSDTSSSEEFLTATTPEYSIISCGIYNQYNFPDKDVVDRLKSIGSTVLQTDKNGNITFFIDKNSDIKVKTSK